MPEPSQDLRDGLVPSDEETPVSAKGASCWACTRGASTWQAGGNLYVQRHMLTRHQLNPRTDDAEWEKEKADLKKDVNKAADKAEKHGKEFKKLAKVGGAQGLAVCLRKADTDNVSLSSTTLRTPLPLTGTRPPTLSSAPTSSVVSLVSVSVDKTRVLKQY